MNQKGAAHIFFILILLAGIAIAVYLTQFTQVFKPKASENSTCKVTDSATLKSCFSRASADASLTQIEITKQIICSGKQDCEINLNTRSTPLAIFGTPGTNAGFRRSQNYDYPILLLGDLSKTRRLSGITVKDLIFDESTTDCDFIKEGVAKCNSPLAFINLDNTIVDHITILHSKSHGIQIAEVNNFTIKNSIVYNSGANGLWFGAAYTPDCVINFDNYTPCAIDENKVNKYVTIENNLIADSRIAGVEFYGFADAQRPNSIKGNFITHNHRDSRYTVCPPPNGHCPGGQLVIARSNHTVIEENVISKGIIDAINPKTGQTFHSEGLKATGIELSDTISDIMIKNNKIFGQTGAVLFSDYVGPQYKIKDVGIFWNMVYDNGSNFVGAGHPNLEGAYGFGIANNIVDKPTHYVGAPFTKAFIFADPPVCVPVSGSQCTSTIRWYSNDYADLKAGIKESPDSLFASGPNGSQNAPWISTAGATFELRNPVNNQVLSSVLAIAYSSTPSPSASTLPSPSPSSSTPASPSPSAKTGDVDGDGDVDIFDFNVVTANFGKTNDPLTKADLDNDDDVDIFDYNIVVGNFGK